MVRPMISDDAGSVFDVMVDAFADLEARLGAAPTPPSERGPGLLRIHHLIDTDPGGAWVSEDETGAVDGAALALIRDGLWALSLLVVRPGRQSTGAGSRLLRAARAYGADARGGLILASEDERALRAYWRAGFRLRPVFDACGPITTRPELPAAVRPGRWPADRDLVDAASRAARGAAHGSDIDALLDGGCELSVHEAGGFVMRRGARIRILAAVEEPVARELLQAALWAIPEGEGVQLDFLDAQQDWAIDVALAAGLRLVSGGALCVRGEVGPLRPYIPSGSYL